MRVSRALTPAGILVLCGMSHLSTATAGDPYYLQPNVGYGCHEGGTRVDDPDANVLTRRDAAAWPWFVDAYDGQNLRACWVSEYVLAQSAVAAWNAVILTDGCDHRYQLSLAGATSNEPNLSCADNATVTSSTIVFVEDFTSPSSAYHWLYTTLGWSAGTLGERTATWDDDGNLTQGVVYLNAEHNSWVGCNGEPCVGGKSRTKIDRNLSPIIIHELGHVLGIGHSDANNDIMSSSLSGTATDCDLPITDADKEALTWLLSSRCTADPIAAVARVDGGRAKVEVHGVPAIVTLEVVEGAGVRKYFCNTASTTRSLVYQVGTGVPDPAGSGWGVQGVIPNPTFGNVAIQCRVLAGERSQLEVCDAGGRLIRRLVLERAKGAESTGLWDGRDDLGHRLPAGVYFVTLRGEGRTSGSRVVILK